MDDQATTFPSNPHYLSEYKTFEVRHGSFSFLVPSLARLLARAYDYQITQDVQDAKAALSPASSDTGNASGSIRSGSASPSVLLALPSQEPWLQPLPAQFDASAAAGTVAEASEKGVSNNTKLCKRMRHGLSSNKRPAIHKFVCAHTHLSQ